MAVFVWMRTFFFGLILSAPLGNFPVPLIGYGSSPIIGYLISVSYMEKEILLYKRDNLYTT